MGFVGQLGGGFFVVVNGFGQFGGGFNLFSGQFVNIFWNGGVFLGGLWFDQFFGSVECGLGGINLVSLLWWVNMILGSFFGWGYVDGGYIGNMSEKVVVGVVYGGEYVFSKVVVDKIGLMNFDFMYRMVCGYVMGGYVGLMFLVVVNNNNVSGNVQVNIVNNNGFDVSQKLCKMVNGMVIDVMIDEVVVKKVLMFGSGMCCVMMF